MTKVGTGWILAGGCELLYLEEFITSCGFQITEKTGYKLSRLVGITCNMRLFLMVTNVV